MRTSAATSSPRDGGSGALTPAQGDMGSGGARRHFFPLTSLQIGYASSFILRGLDVYSGGLLAELVISRWKFLALLLLVRWT
uniref:Uncharacterized protein n=1 Tax=Triticum urartu TaxID=4572 RepID=A0A8R7QTE1_TRIUA